MLLTDPCLFSVRTCREAALQVSYINSLPIFENIADTYAVSFVALHLLSAAVTLSISASLNPMSQESHNCKLGLHRLVDMQAQMRSKSIVAEQGFAVLKKLLRLVLLKETELMLQFPERENVICEETGTYSHDRRALLGASEVLIVERRESRSRQDELGDPLQTGTSISATSLPDLAAQLDFEFFEDPVISQAVAEFEKGMCLQTFKYRLEAQHTDDITQPSIGYLHRPRMMKSRMIRAWTTSRVVTLEAKIRAGYGPSTLTTTRKVECIRCPKVTLHHKQL
jgi:hypothetical protein